ncbi:hypothetical protein [Flavihumibacter sp. UBA7668]|uniref:hypothetical protein n=1 Tax=Flavihumibacter sp. UBA7668 TaxID=1946542 RepID=UPI0025BE0517|nr:hypothetical protein [Flavihumibacter sp. UBA7668]
MMPIVVKLPNGNIVDPIAKAFKRFHYGEAESIHYFYHFFTSSNSRQNITPDNISYPPGKFEFLICGEIELSPEQFTRLMMPVSFQVKQVERNELVYFQADGDEFSYSCEPPGIQMTFNDECTYQKARKIADEVVHNLTIAGFSAELIVLDNSKIYKFE